MRSDLERLHRRVARRGTIPGPSSSDQAPQPPLSSCTTPGMSRHTSRLTPCSALLADLRSALLYASTAALLWACGSASDAPGASVERLMLRALTARATQPTTTLLAHLDPPLRHRPLDREPATRALRERSDPGEPLDAWIRIAGWPVLDRDPRCPRLPSGSTASTWSCACNSARRCESSCGETRSASRSSPCPCSNRPTRSVSASGCARRRMEPPARC